MYVSLAVYHVGENGWTQVWAGDTTKMYYNYYPAEGGGPAAVEEGEEEKKNGA